MLKTTVAMTLLSLALAACGSDDDATPPATGDFVFSVWVETPDGSTSFVVQTDDMPAGSLDLTNAMEIAGGGDVFEFNGSIYISRNETVSLTRYDAGSGLEARETISFAGTGATWVGEPLFLSETRAFVSGPEFTLIEFDPTAMVITDEHDISALQREGWGNEQRGLFLRDDGVIFIYWTYTNDRVEFINDLVVGVYDVDARTLAVLEDTQCPATAGFGGFFDEQGDLYLIADNFGGFTRFGDTPDQKTGCIVRINDGERTFDDGFRFKTADVMGGLEPWGFYYAGDGIAYTTGVDPARINDYNSVFEFIFAPIHEGWTIDLGERSAARLDGVPADGVGFSSIRVDGDLLVPRSTGSIEIFEIENIETTVYRLNGASRAISPQFTTPGYLGNAIRLRD